MNSTFHEDYYAIHGIKYRPRYRVRELQNCDYLLLKEFEKWHSKTPSNLFEINNRFFLIELIK